MQFFNTDLVLIFWLLFFYSGAWVLQMIFIWYFYARFAFHTQREINSRDYPVSVIICAKDECFNLRKNLPLILEQDYSDFEVVVVNDASCDESEELLEQFKNRYKHLKVVSITADLNFFKGKKFPLSVGIKSAKNEYLLLTDADCSPTSRIWIRKMMSGFTRGKEVVLGYSPHRSKKSLLGSVIRFDTFYIGLQYLSFALSGNAYMAVGRNLAYKKSLFFRNKGFQSHYKVASGDDDLFINQAATKENVAIQYDPDSHMLTEPVQSISQLIKQKKRHLGTGKYYKSSNKLLLGLNISSMFVFYSLFILLLFISGQYLFVTGLFALRFVSQMIIIKKSMQKLNEKDLLLISPLYEVLLLLFNVLISISNIFIRQQKWK